MHYKNIIWDWNGTILNDISQTISAMNAVLEKRKLSLLDEKRYKKLFTFPVKEYYKELGFDFDKEKFEIPANEFIDEYINRQSEMKIFPDIEKNIKQLYENGYSLHILSAMQINMLVSQVKDFNLQHYFTSVNGIDNHYANGKDILARNFFEREKLVASETVLIGDTLHDAEVAEKLNIDCILISWGHQNKERLVKSGFPVIDSPEEINLIKK